jgi:glycosyltransferase involved in cell wall biosynthesis
MKKKELTIIIPTFNRSNSLISILQSLSEQSSKEYRINVIICDSYSKDDSEKNVKLFSENNQNLDIKYLNIDANILAAKRNFGIKNSSSRFNILIDDDCIPDNNFIKDYIESLEVMDEKTILSGIVLYPKQHILNSNYLKFKSNTHFKKIDTSNNTIESNHMVAMNMAFLISDDLLKTKLFDEGFIGYGFEDYEFAYRLKEVNFKLKQTKATIIHDEGTPRFDKYLKKYFHLGRDGMKNLLRINYMAALDTIYYKLESNILYKLISKIPKISLLLRILENIIIKIDKVKLIYLPFFYNVARFSSYMRGYIERNKKSLNLQNNNWYE